MHYYVWAEPGSKNSSFDEKKIISGFPGVLGSWWDSRLCPITLSRNKAPEGATRAGTLPSQAPVAPVSADPLGWQEELVPSLEAEEGYGFGLPRDLPPAPKSGGGDSQN